LPEWLVDRRSQVAIGQTIEPLPQCGDGVLHLTGLFSTCRLARRALGLVFVAACCSGLFELALFDGRGPEHLDRTRHLADFVTALNRIDGRLIVATKDTLHTVADGKDTAAKDIAVKIEQAEEQHHGDRTKHKLQLDGFGRSGRRFGDTGAKRNPGLVIQLSERCRHTLASPVDRIVDSIEGFRRCAILDHRLQVNLNDLGHLGEIGIERRHDLRLADGGRQFHRRRLSGLKYRNRIRNQRLPLRRHLAIAAIDDDIHCHQGQLDACEPHGAGILDRILGNDGAIQCLIHP
jgi:hypothetical protein